MTRRLFWPVARLTYTLLYTAWVTIWSPVPAWSPWLQIAAALLTVLGLAGLIVLATERPRPAPFPAGYTFGVTAGGPGWPGPVPASSGTPGRGTR